MPISGFYNPAEPEFFEDAAPKLTADDIRDRYLNRNCFVEVGTGSDRKAGTKNVMEVRCTVREVRVVFGNIRVMVEPMDGRGSMMVDVNKLGDPH